jgi:hypothetical protein
MVLSSVSGVFLKENDRYWKSRGSQRRTTLSRRSSTGPSGPYPPLFGAFVGAAIADLAMRPLNGPADAPTVAAAATALRRRNVRRSMVLIGFLPCRIPSRAKLS